MKTRYIYLKLVWMKTFLPCKRIKQRKFRVNMWESDLESRDIPWRRDRSLHKRCPSQSLIQKLRPRPCRPLLWKMCNNSFQSSRKWGSTKSLKSSLWFDFEANFWILYRVNEVWTTLFAYSWTVIQYCCGDWWNGNLLLFSVWWQVDHIKAQSEQRKFWPFRSYAVNLE